VVALGVAAVGAAATQALTGAIGDATSSLEDRLTGEDEPLHVSAFHRLSAETTAFRSSSYLLPKRLDSVPFPGSTNLDDPQARRGWARSQGAVDAYSTDVAIVIEGKAETPVVLLDLRVRVVARRPPPAWSHLLPPGAGAVAVRYFHVDLDDSPPRLRYGVPDEPTGDPPVQFPYRVSASDPEVFYIIAETQRCDCSWIAELDWSAGGRSGTTRIDDGGKPFRTASAVHSTAYAVEGRRFVRHD
jgi:hypothetical protein